MSGHNLALAFCVIGMFHLGRYFGRWEQRANDRERDDA